MLCECCQQHEATIHLTQVIEGTARELHVCEDCAEESGLQIQNMMSIPELLFGMGAEGDESKTLAKTCPHCHLRGGDFKKTARLGCPRCYETFAEELEPMLAAMHKGSRHVGKVPAEARKTLAAEALKDDLKRRLDKAVSAEDYEEAARLRDQMREAGRDDQ
jgi:protein arginine kinase activator